MPPLVDATACGRPPSPLPSPTRCGEGIATQFLCPLTQRVMREPVVASDGFTYERTAIEVSSGGGCGLGFRGFRFLGF